MTISGDSSGVVFNNNGFLAVPTGTCVIQVTQNIEAYLPGSFASISRLIVVGEGDVSVWCAEG